MDKKYELIPSDAKWLYRVKALRNFADVKKGDVGGYIQSEENLSHEDNCWVYDNAKVSGNAWVYHNAKVCGNAWVYDNAKVLGNANVCGNSMVYGEALVYGRAMVCDNASVYGDARVFGEAKICGDAVVESNRDYIVFKNFWSSGRYFTWTRSNNMWRVGCFYGSGEELIKKAYKDSEESGKYYEFFVNSVKSLEKLK